MRVGWLLLLVFGCAGDSGQTQIDSGVKPQPTVAETCPSLAAGTWRGGDGSRDADSDTAWFRSVLVPGITDVDYPTSGASWVDLNGDDQLDVLLAKDDHLVFLRNDGCFQMVPEPLELPGFPTLDGGVGGPLSVDFNQDGFLDMYVPFHGLARQAQLWISDGAWNRFTEQAVAQGVANPGNYGRAGPSVGDVNGDGWLDFAVGGHQIGSATSLGRPLPGLFVFRPGPVGFDDGRFENLAGTSKIPGFGGVDVDVCDPGDERTGLKVLLRDLDDDGDLDLLWATHNDMFHTKVSEECPTGENRYGLAVWEAESPVSEQMNELPETSENVVDLGRMSVSPADNHFVVGPEGGALGPEYVTLFDADNDGDRDLIAIGPTDPDWTVSSVQVQPDQAGQVATFFRNDSNVWSDETEQAGLDALQWTLGEWMSFFEGPLASHSTLMELVCLLGPQPPFCRDLQVADRQPYPSQVLTFDADNDGFTDILYLVRQCVYDSVNDDRVRSVLFHNNGDGTFEPLRSEISGIQGCGLGAFAVDIDRDGWLDLHFANREFLQANNSFTDYVFRNRGADLPQGDRHWLRINLDGRPFSELLGARVTALDADGNIVSNGWYAVEAWRGSREPTVHLGLGAQTAIIVEVKLRDGTVVRYEDVAVDATMNLSL
ncbi:MAG: hypothetical protein GWP91_09175 [Rhodobacterales bacterium]|nr:hypothetical protein [Rhodobacterales bacterium]